MSTMTLPPKFTALALMTVVTLSMSRPGTARAQAPSSSSEAVRRVWAMSACLGDQVSELERLLILITQAERQRERSSGEAVRRDAELSLDALLQRAEAVREAARGCLESEQIVSLRPTTVVRPPPADPSADSVAETGGTVRETERQTQLAPGVLVVRGEQVDGQGSLSPGVVRTAVASVGPRLRRCYDRYLERGSLGARELELVFTFRGRGPATGVAIEESGFGDRAFEGCVRAAAGRLVSSASPSGGAVTYSYRFRFGG